MADIVDNGLFDSLLKTLLEAVSHFSRAYKAGGQDRVERLQDLKATIEHILILVEDAIVAAEFDTPAGAGNGNGGE